MKSLKNLLAATLAHASDLVQKPAARVGAAFTGLTLAATTAMAQTATNPIVVLLESIDLVTVAAAIGVIALVIVGIALAMKGPDVSKRVIRKV